MINLSGKNQIVLCISAGVLGVVMFTAMLFIHKVPAYRPQTMNGSSYETILTDQAIQIAPEASFFAVTVAEAAASAAQEISQMPAMPTPPQIPQQPGGSSAGIPSGKLTVIGVLPPSVVIMQRGGQTITAKVGQQTDFGFVDSISKTGASIDGSWYELN